MVAIEHRCSYVGMDVSALIVARVVRVVISASTGQGGVGPGRLRRVITPPSLTALWALRSPRGPPFSKCPRTCARMQHRGGLSVRVHFKV